VHLQAQQRLQEEGCVVDIIEQDEEAERGDTQASGHQSQEE